MLYTELQETDFTGKSNFLYHGMFINSPTVGWATNATRSTQQMGQEGFSRPQREQLVAFYDRYCHQRRPQHPPGITYPMNRRLSVNMRNRCLILKTS